MEPKSQFSRFVWLGILCGFLIALVYLACLPRMANFRDLATAAFFFCCYAGIFLALSLAPVWAWVVVHHFVVDKPRRRKAKLTRYRKILREKIRIREQNREVAQLNKPDFDSRLSEYVSNAKERIDSRVGSDSDLEIDRLEAELEFDSSDDQFSSNMPYWQRNSFHQGKMPMPVDLIRSLIRRISIAVYKGRHKGKPFKKPAR